jgi:hypothetical protein
MLDSFFLKKYVTPTRFWYDTFSQNVQLVGTKVCTFYKMFNPLQKVQPGSYNAFHVFYPVFFIVAQVFGKMELPHREKSNHNL